jgi:uncharacterized membrane protein YuzA (DUF378 family)
MDKIIKLIATILVIIGGIAWGFVGTMDKFIVEDILGKDYAKYIYILVGIASLTLIGLHFTKKPEMEMPAIEAPAS